MSLRICPQAFLHLHMMKKIVLLQLVVLMFSCNNQTSFKKAEDAQDAGREFIRASLDGDYDKATFYLLQDSTNQMLMGKWKKDYDQLDADSKNRYKEADILPINVTTQNDS